MLITLEVRGRLGVATMSLLGVPTDFPPIRSRIEGSNLVISTSSPGVDDVLCIPLPLDKTGLNADFLQIAQMTLGDPGEVQLRLNLQLPGQLDLLSLSSDKSLETLKNWSSTLSWPKNVQKDSLGKTCQIICNRCSKTLNKRDLVFRRCLPLPSISWKEFSQDWFCGCQGHGKQAKCAKLDIEVNNINMAKSSSALEPKPGDVLFAPGFSILNKEEFDNESVNVNNGDELECSSCCSSLGQMVGNAYQLWQHSSQIRGTDTCLCTSEKVALKCDIKATFSDLISGLLSECPEKSVRIYLTSHSSILMIWILDQDLKLFTQSCKFGDQRIIPELEEIKVMKVMYKLHDKDFKIGDINAQVLRVCDEIIQAGKDELELKRHWMPQSSSNANISYIISNSFN